MYFTTEEPPYSNLVKAAVGAKDKAYCPYSNFHVGAAVLSSSDQIFTGNRPIFQKLVLLYTSVLNCSHTMIEAFLFYVVGANVENASYGLCVCAERVAIMNAVSQGYTDLKAMAVCW